MALTEREEKELLLLLEQDLLYNNFYAFCQYMDPLFFSADKPHLQQIAEAYQAITDGQINKLAVSTAPRGGKSYITSLWCAWMMGRSLVGAIMRNSYAADLAYSFSYDIRQIVQTEKYLKVFPRVKLKADRKAVDDWALETSKRSAYFCAGVGGPITGKGCDIAGILDDPIKNIEEALSETVMDKIWKWYTSTHLSRFESGCPEIHIATRWSRNDPIGRLTDQLSEYYDGKFEVIKIPALDDYGKTFCPAIKTTEEYLAIKKITEDFIWEAEFMQNPIESKGLLFPVDDLKRFSLADLADKKPDATIGYADTADSGTDFHSVPIGKIFGEYTYITDVYFTQDGVEITEPLTAQLVIDTGCEKLKVESNAGGKSFARNVLKLLREAKNNSSVIYEPNMQNKETRILMAAGYIKEHFYFRDDYEAGSDYDKFMRQLISYVKMGKNKHDDAPDSLTGLSTLSKLIAKPRGEKPKKTVKPQFSFEKPKVNTFTGGKADKSYINY